MLNNNNKGVASIAVMLGMFILITSVGASLYGIKGSYDFVNDLNYNIDSNVGAERSIEDVKNYFSYNNNKYNFLDYNNQNPCLKTGGIKTYGKANIVSNETNISDLILMGEANDENLNEEEGFLNRSCSIYTQGYPNVFDAKFKYKIEPNLSINSKDISRKGNADENGYYNVGQINDNENIGFIFTKKQIGNISNLDINLDYNFNENGNNGFNIYKENIKEKILLYKKAGGLEVTKPNLKNLIDSTFYTHNNAFLEIGLISFEGGFSKTSGYSIKSDTGKVELSNHVNNGTSRGTLNGRLLCDNNGVNCRLENIVLDDDKIYYFYLKSFNKNSTYHLDFINGGSGLPIQFPSDKLYIKTYGFSNGFINKKTSSVKLSELNGNFVSNFSSAIFNYVYYSSF